MPDLATIATVIGTMAGLIALLPVLKEFKKRRKISKEASAIIEEEKRRTEVKPNFELQLPSSAHNFKIIKLRNIGSRATRIVLVAMSTTGWIPSMLKVDKNEVEKFESLNIFLGDDSDFKLLRHVTIGISYQDVDNRQYQQNYIQTSNGEMISSPELLTTHINKKRIVPRVLSVAKVK